MNPFILLMIAIVSEVFGSTMLKVSHGFKRLFPSLGVVLGMGMAFYLLSITLTKIPLSTAYAIWSGVGTALTAVVGMVLFKERAHIQKIIGLILIISGVVALRISNGT
ncbi:QacE family quaternary ammonium compound efflux SMR transporter [Virgibacillus pantothenticus]|uniref:Quaternary ammonium transporter n=1 Tax=Virgibacillus pantothenticus TaxID=1473 RepID=A0A0L0QN26_VIRPA|nr:MULTISPECIES: multidrug efflux SMR transporter [Virgibacillus]API93639.1 QacE family quaternary ammonium compound efflux SMR transporter [Virgibacillus sp. 6R]KNE19929.1 quaternary ammonium transporter [Virgibacillus pantothenticus]MBS7429968.1 multidrug efflux SMR transporter [Virgibacillus sp. 19R1-5]MBU8564934.1 multidrug efflux SMR transporter [Virgibacillus pantothenticus]MBU8599242.1 multidrug efflux SMR transporter [Virgibacillus pantothenticus]